MILKRMVRWTRAGLTVISTVLLIAAVGLWTRSYWVLDDVSGADENGVTRAVVSFKGGLHFSRSQFRVSPHHVTWFPYPFGADADLSSLYSYGSVQWSFLGFKQLDQTPAPPAAVVGMSRTPRIVPWLNLPPFEAWVVPYWFIALVVGILPGRAVFRFFRRRLRMRRRFCPDCGYDVRATPEQCPECGVVLRPAIRRFAKKDLATEQVR